jgi:hypothetical protein
VIGAVATGYAREIARILITSVGHAMECPRNEILEGLSQQLSRDLEGVLEEILDLPHSMSGLHPWSQVDEALSRWLNSLAGDLLQKLEPAIRALFVFLSCYSFFRVPSLETRYLRRAAVEELFRIHFLSVRTQQKIDEQ